MFKLCVLSVRSRGRLWWNLPVCVAIATLSGVMGIVMPMLMPYWVKHGLTPGMIWFLQGAFAVTLALCIIPTGYLADVKSRKACLMIGVALCLVGDLIYAYGSSFGEFLTAEILLGVGMAFTAGADGALLYDTLVVRKESKSFACWAAWGAAGMFVVSALANLSSGFLVEINERLPFLVSASFMVLQLLLVFTLKEPPTIKEKRLVSVRQLAGVFRFCILENFKLRWIIVAWSVLGVGSWLVVWFYPIYFAGSGWSVKEQGRIFAFYQLVAAVASLAARRFKNTHAVLSSIFVGFAICLVLGHMLFGLLLVSWGFLFGALHQVCRGAVPVVFSSALHHQTPSHIRATVSSIQGALATALYGVVNLRLGYAAEAFGFQAVLLSVGLGVAGISALVWAYRPRAM